MLTLYYAPNSRASRVHQLCIELGALRLVNVVPVSIARMDGTGWPDAINPHPEGKVPLLDHNGELVWETAAIFIYLADLFPENGLAPMPGHTGRGQYLSWMSWYSGVLEPVMLFHLYKVEHPALRYAYRGLREVRGRLETILSHQPYLMGAQFSAADLLIADAFGALPDAMPQSEVISEWVMRCRTRPSVTDTMIFDKQLAAE
ncbi:glutathione S-transferase family protein [Pseudooceanicola nanhaiensis]|uniref:glutathione S-transferase family protein n=1 Tax=Pseudooceanicola nanhaiensis TaxID=375761 RepID=UPI001CD1C847|nr:glutathione S-transferase family protein [Pseudooceanicola nanhaiensis]MCA0920427.1 glutathione S-transferase family protein [Pseudooceanicola nanhaiensis]